MKKKIKKIEYLKVSKTYPVLKTLMKIICRADDFLMHAYNPRENWKDCIIRAQGELEKAMQLIEAEQPNNGENI
jgi:hypothetical protein